MAGLRTLIKLGVAAGAVVAAKKVADRYKLNNPDGVEDPNGKVNEIKKASREIYNETANVIKEKTPQVIGSVKDTARKASDFANEKFPGVKEKIMGAVEKVSEKIDEKVPSAAEKFEDAVDRFAEKAEAFVNGAEEKAEEKEDRTFDDVVDAEFTPVEEKEEE